MLVSQDAMVLWKRPGSGATLVMDCPAASEERLCSRSLLSVLACTLAL